MKKFTILTAFVLFSIRLLAQPPGDPGVDPDVPITGIEILIGAGGIYGLRKMLRKKEK
jgi:hypothetical protein